MQVSHGALARFASAIGADMGTDGDSVVLSAAAPIFDALFMDLAVSLGRGGRLVRLNARGLAEPGYLASAAETHGATYMDVTPSVWRAALASGFVPGSEVQVVTGGEALDGSLARALSAEGARLFNSYGPTEATVVAIAGEVCGASDTIPLGRVLPGTRAYVLDGHLNAVPLGVAGELVLGGGQIADGYLGRSGLTSGVFVADPFSATAGARAYRTGDLVRWRSDGQLEFLGRIDAQVKIRGQRVELGEIEAALTGCAGIASAAVVARGTPSELVAYLVTTEDAGQAASGAPELLDLEAIDLGALRADLARRLPDHMIPQGFARLSHVPLTPSGKTDRRALPEVEVRRAQAAYEAPETPTEILIAAQIAALIAAESGGEAGGDTDTSEFRG